jgi:hypothetical protein
MSELDARLYKLFQRCEAAGLPVQFCGDDSTRKWELVALLESQLRDAENRRHEQAAL